MSRAIVHSAKESLPQVSTNLWLAETVSGDVEDNWNTRKRRFLVALPALHIVLRPFLFILRLLGFFHLNPSRHKSSSKLYFLFSIYQKVASAILVFFMWGTAFFNLINFDLADFSFDHGTLTRIVYLCWFIQNALAVTLYSYASLRHHLLQKLEDEWNELRFPSTVSTQIIQFCRRLQWFMLLAVVVVSIVISFVIIEVFVVHGELQDVYVDTDIRFKHVTVGVYGLMGVVNGVVWVVSLVFYLLLCWILRYLFQAHALNLSREVREEDPRFIDFEEHRHSHELICMLANTINDILNELVFSYLLFYLLILCLMAYEIVGMPDEMSMMLVRGFWCCLSAGTIVLVCVTGAAVNTTAHLPYMFMNQYSLKYLPSNQSTQFIAFVMKLIGPKIDLTAWGMTEINKGILLTMASVFLTYLLLLVQLQSVFKQTDNNNRLCNNNNTVFQ